MKPAPAISVVADAAPPAQAPRDAAADGLEALVEAFAATLTGRDVGAVAAGARPVRRYRSGGDPPHR